MEQYQVTGMSCAACSARVEKAVSGVPGVTSCSVSLLTNSMGVEGSASPGAIIAAVEEAGYGASKKGAAREEAVRDRPLGEEVRDAVPRVEGRIRVLEDDLQRAPLREGAAEGQGGAVEQDLALGRDLQPREHPRERRLARSRFADERERLARAQLERDLRHGRDAREDLRERAGGEERGMLNAEC